MSLNLDLQYINRIQRRLERFTPKSGNLFNFRCNVCGDGTHGNTRGYFHTNKKKTGYSFTCHNCGGLDGKTVSFQKWLKDFDYNVYQDYLMDSMGTGRTTFSETPKKTVDSDEELLLSSTSKPLFKRNKPDETFKQPSESDANETTTPSAASIEIDELEIDIPISDAKCGCAEDDCDDADDEGAIFASGNPFANRPNFGGHAKTVDSSQVPDLPDIEDDFTTIVRPNLENLRKLSDLPNGHGALKYIQNRMIPEQFYDKMYLVWKFYTWCNEWKPNSFKQSMCDFFEEPRLIIPFYNKEGELMMIQGRSFKKDAKIRYFSIKCDDDFPKVYGLERIDYSKIVQVWEGPLDSLFGENAAAMAGADANPSEYFDDYVLIYDNEPRNPDICKRIQRAISQGQKVCIWPKMIPEKYDGNDMIMKLGLTVPQLNKIIRENTYQGLEAELAFGQWKRVDSKRKPQRRKTMFDDLGI